MLCLSFILLFFFFNDTATTAIYTLSLHDALPISIPSSASSGSSWRRRNERQRPRRRNLGRARRLCRSEEHTSELQSRENLVCRLLLEKKKKTVFNTVFFIIQSFMISGVIYSYQLI